jgi:elongation factor G
MHANDREDIPDAGPGDIAALLAVDCANGDTLCGEGINYSLESIFVADPVISLSVIPASNADQERMGKALSRFMKEDPTFRVSTDPETGETIIAGMGELHLDVYVERMKREYKANVTVGAPSVRYTRAPTSSQVRYRNKNRREFRRRPSGRSLIPIPTATRPLEFEDIIVGGRIRRVFPGVNKASSGDEDGPTSRATRSSAARCALTTAPSTR